MPTLEPRNHYYYLHEILGEAQMTQAEYGHRIGLDNRPTLNRAMEHFKACLDRNP